MSAQTTATGKALNYDGHGNRGLGGPRSYTTQCCGNNYLCFQSSIPIVQRMPSIRCIR